MEKLNSWTLYPSKQQSYWEVLLLLLTMAMLWPFLNIISWLVLLVLFSVVAIFAWRQRQNLRVLMQQENHWWLLQNLTKTELQWRTGSVRSKNLIIWRYGKWPWQRLIIHPDSVSKAEYQQLLYQLALKLS